MTLGEVLIQNLNIWLQNFNSQSAQLHSILLGGLSQFISIFMGALDAILPPT